MGLGSYIILALIIGCCIAVALDDKGSKSSSKSKKPVKTEVSASSNKNASSKKASAHDVGFKETPTAEEFSDEKTMPKEETTSHADAQIVEVTPEPQVTED